MMMLIPILAMLAAGAHGQVKLGPRDGAGLPAADLERIKHIELHNDNRAMFMGDWDHFLHQSSACLDEIYLESLFGAQLKKSAALNQALSYYEIGIVMSGRDARYSGLDRLPESPLEEERYEKSKTEPNSRGRMQKIAETDEKQMST